MRLKMLTFAVITCLSVGLSVERAAAETSATIRISVNLAPTTESWDSPFSLRPDFASCVNETGCDVDMLAEAMIKLGKQHGEKRSAHDCHRTNLASTVTS